MRASASLALPASVTSSPAFVQRFRHRPPDQHCSSPTTRRAVGIFSKHSGKFSGWHPVVPNLSAIFRENRAARSCTAPECSRPGPISNGIRLASLLRVLHLEALAPPTPQLPRHRFGGLTQLAPSAALHAIVVVVVTLLTSELAPGIDVRRPEAITEQQPPDVRHIVFLVPELPKLGGGGGGGGNQQQGPIRRAQGIGSDAITLRVQEAPSPVPVTAPAAPVGVSCRSLRSCSTRSRWLPASSSKSACRRLASCRARRPVQAPAVASDRAQGPASARDADPGWAPIRRRNRWRRLQAWRVRDRAARDHGGQADVHKRRAAIHDSRLRCARTHRHTGRTSV